MVATAVTLQGEGAGGMAEEVEMANTKFGKLL